MGDSDVGKQEILAGFEDGTTDSPFCSSSGAGTHHDLQFLSIKYASIVFIYDVKCALSFIKSSLIFFIYYVPSPLLMVYAIIHVWLSIATAVIPKVCSAEHHLILCGLRGYH